MKKMNKILAILLAFVMMFALAACGGKDGAETSKDGSETAKTTSVSGDMVTAEIPDGWCLVTGTDMFGIDTADFICPTDEYKSGDPYLQIEEYPQDLDGAKAVLESGSPFGTYAGEKSLANGTWYLAENAAVAQLGEKVIMVKGYKCDFASDEVQSILGSLQWIK